MIINVLEILGCYLMCFNFLFSMFNLYNLLENPYSRFCVYMKALSLALNGKVTEHIIPSFKKMDSFLKEWNIGVQDQRELFISVSNVLKENKRYNGIPFLLVSMFGHCYLFCSLIHVIFMFLLPIFEFQLSQGFFQISDQVPCNLFW